VTQTSSRHLRFRGRSFPVLALEPELPLPDWIDRLDDYLACSPSFFSKKAIVIDVSKLELDREMLNGLLENLTKRGIRILGVTGVDPAWASDDLPPILSAGRPAVVVEERIRESASDTPTANGELTPSERSAFEEIGEALGDSDDSMAGKSKSAPAPETVSVFPLVVDASVRSGQTILYPQGDVIIIGSVSSGADVIAGGSIHIYGTLRGRAMAGAYGEMRSRIFCRRLEAELLAVGGIYQTADEIDKNMHGQNVQVWLEKEDVRITRLD
jgi:septum site-determining protein MinC